MWSFAAVERILRKRITHRVPRSLEHVATKTWVIAPGETSIAAPAYYLPNQLERVTGWEFASEHPRRAMEGGIVYHVPTRAFLLKNAWLIDGVLSKNDACAYLRARSSRWPRLHVEREVDRGAMYCSFGGNKWFGQWLMDDCVTYPLACAEGAPITLGPAKGVHITTYENWFGMKPTRLESAYFREVVTFEDFSQNQNRQRRFRALSEQLLSHVEVRSHPGVFILRGSAGERRVMRNEMEVADYLRARRGFRILDPMKADVPTIVSTCAGARSIVGVEGSALAHGLVLLPPGGALLTLQPPKRFVTFYKPHTDCNQQHFGFVVGFPQGEDFGVDPAEVERTLDLFPKNDVTGWNWSDTAGLAQRTTKRESELTASSPSKW